MHARASRRVLFANIITVVMAAGLVPACSGGDSTDPGPATRAVTVSSTGTGTGTITSSPAGINCGSTCAATLATGSAITLTAAPSATSSFVSWSGACSGTTTTCTIPAGSAAVTASARFDLQTFTLTVALAGTGTGTVTSSPTGITCGSDCSEPYNAGTSVTLTAAPSANSTFAGWSGGGCTGTGTCVVAMNAAANVTATFTLQTFNLTVVPAGTGAGTVTSAPAGINCGATCSAPFATGTAVTLTAAATAGSTFTGWSGGGCTGTGTCVVTVNAATSVTATFTLQTFALTVTRAGNGAGTVTSAPAGINCGATCTQSFNAGTAVTLTAAPTAGSNFTGWSGGGCTGTGTCVVTMNAAASVTATFTLTTNMLTVTLVGAGTVTSSPAGITCGATCASAFNFGTVVTLTAVATDGNAFTGWSGGGCTGTGTCVVTTNAATTVTATFTAIQPRWPDSGTRTCSDLSAFVACPGGPVGQDGYYTINVPNYVVVGGRVQDPITGLVWERNASTTERTLASAQTYCTTLMLDGFADWRVPTYLELVSIADFGAVGPAFTSSAFPGIPQNSNYWTSTDWPGNPALSYGINTNYPTTNTNTKTDASGHLVRCVRGTTFSGALSVAGGSVTDARTGLVWQSGTAPTDLTYADALSYCEALVLDGNSDWRLPNGKELMSIVDVTRTNPSISPLFASRPSTRFWSSSLLANIAGSGYVIAFDQGLSAGIDTPATQARSVRCVR